MLYEIENKEGVYEVRGKLKGKFGYLGTAAKMEFQDYRSAVDFLKISFQPSDEIKGINLSKVQEIGLENIIKRNK